MTQDGQPYNVVVVDDEAPVCQLIKRYLNEDNFSVTALTDAAEVLNAIQDKKPCLVVLDIHMPRKSGMELLKDIKETWPDMPVVMVTGDQDPIKATEASKLGACDYLTKPIDWKYLKNIAYLCSFLRESKV